MSTDNQHPGTEDAQATTQPDAAESGAAHTDPAAEPTPEQAASDAAAPEAAAPEAAAPDAAAQSETASGPEDRVAQAEQRAQEYLESLQRERAAFQNYKRRVERERVEQRQIAVGEVLIKLLPTLDDFHRAMEAIPDTERDDDWFQGVVLIRRKLERFLEEQGVKEMDALGAEFDPAYHEAIGVDSDTDAASGTITAVLQRGYLHGERVLRAAMVRVAE